MKATGLHKVNSKTILVLLAFMAVVFALFATAQMASAGGAVFRVKGDIESILGPPPNNFCTGEPMDAQGEVVLLLHETGAGMALHINGAGATMTGTETGTLYHFNGALNEFVSVDDDGYHSVHHFSWFSPSNGDAFIATFVSHTTVNGNGEVTANFNFLNGGCK
jgi:hypothetical protein